MSNVKYPEVKFQLVGVDSNAFGIMGAAQKAAKKAGLTEEQIEEYLTEAMSGDYNNVITTTLKYFGGNDDEMTEEEADAEWDEHWEKMDAERDMEDDDE